MDKKELFEKTAELVFDFQTIEVLLSICLTHNYAGILKKNIYTDIFQPMGLQTKLNLLKKITREKQIKFNFKNAKKYQEIRNILIHGEGFDEGLQFLKKGETSFPVDDLFNKFKEIKEPLKKDLMNLMEKIGVSFEDKNETTADSYDFPIWGNSKK